MFKSATFMHR